MHILYVDTSIDRSISRILSRFGTVHVATDVNDAFRSLVDNDISFYFIDADVPNALPFLRHVRHDPSLIPARGYVLLTNNEEEDCDAWGVDTYIQKCKFKSDVPFVFSHPREENGPSARILNIADDHDRYGEGGFREREPSSISPHRFAGRGQESKFDLIGKKPSGPRSLLVERGWRKGIVFVTVVLVVFAIAGSAIVIWRRAGSAESKGKLEKRSQQEEESERTDNESTGHSRGQNDSRSRGGTGDTDSLETAITGGEIGETGVQEEGTTLPFEPVEGRLGPVGVENDESPASPDEVTVTSPPDVDEPAVSVPSVNSNPLVSISGPTQVARGQTAHFTAIASDPEGDQLYYSWSGAAGEGASAGKNFPVPGQYQVSVTVTDGRGGSASASMTINVI